MTSPDATKTPDGALTDTGLAAFAAKTQYSWQADLRSALLGRFLPAQLGFLGIFAGVATAQKSANFANITNTITKATTLAAGVTSGVAVSDPFSGSSANDLGGSWSRTSSGSGSGFYGPNGSGTAVWKPSGNLTRLHIDRYTTPLFTDFQAVMTVMTAVPELKGSFNGYTYLLGRMNSASDTFVYCRISDHDVALGKCVSGTFAAPWISESSTNLPGDQWSFLLGTNGSQREFLVIKNGFVQLQYTDTSSSSFGASYRYVGIASFADKQRRTGQTYPGQLDLFAAADRQSSTT